MSNKSQLQLNNTDLQSILSMVLGLPTQESVKHGAYVWKKYSLNNRLPSGYTELEYIQGTGTQYFNTGVAPNANIVIEIDFGDLVRPSSTDYAVLGSAWGNYSVLYNATNQIKWYASGGGNTTQTVISKNSLKITSSDITVNGSATSISCSSSYPSNNIWLFNTGDNGAGTNYLGRFKLYALKIYNGSTLIRDYVPAKNSNGEVGLYDLVNNTFGKSSGSGEFASGKEIMRGSFINFIVSDNKSAYPDGDIQDGYWYEKVVEDINLESLGCTKYAIDKFTLTTTASLSSISHSLGSVPKMAFINTKDSFVGSSKYSYSTTRATVTISSDNITAVSFAGVASDGSKTCQGIGDSGNSAVSDETTINLPSGLYFEQGVEYIVLTMA